MRFVAFLSLLLTAALATQPSKANPIGTMHDKVVPNHGGFGARAKTPLIVPGQMYTIVDVGAPGYNARPPVAFNNDDQIIGYANNNSKPVLSGGQVGYSLDCYLYTGDGKYIDLSSSHDYVECAPYGISNADASGTVHLFGKLDDIYNQDFTFRGKYMVASEKASLGVIDSNPGFMSLNLGAGTGLNSSGVIVSSRYYQPIGGFFSQSVPFDMPAKSNNPVPIQPQCKVLMPYCFQYAAPQNNACPFGGCIINDSGVTLGIDAYTNTPMTYQIGLPSSGADLKVNFYSNVYLTGALFINNPGNVLFTTVNPYPGFIEGAVLYPATAQFTYIRTLCQATFFSLNNINQVIGQLPTCNSNPPEYFIWDSTNNIQNLSSFIPSNAYSSITPIGINDNGQILVSLITSSGQLHWGFLNPPSIGTSAGRNKQRFVRTSL